MKTTTPNIGTIFLRQFSKCTGIILEVECLEAEEKVYSYEYKVAWFDYRGLRIKGYRCSQEYMQERIEDFQRKVSLSPRNKKEKRKP